MTAIVGTGVAVVAGSGGGGIAHGAIINNFTTSTQTILNNGSADFTMLNTVWDTDGYATGSSLLTIPSGLAGVYLLTCTTSFKAASVPSSGYVQVELFATTNGDLALRSIPWEEFANGGSFASGVTLSVVAKLPAGDVLEWFTSNKLGVSLLVKGSANNFWYQSLSAIYLHS